MSDKPKKPIFKKWWFWVIVVLVIGAIGAAAGGNDDKPSTASQPPAQTAAPTPAQTAATETEQAEPSNIFHVGDTLEAGSLRITYQECDGDWRGYDQYLGPSDGNRVVRAYFVFENIGDTDQYCGGWDFDCYADGVACDRFLWSSDDSLSQSSISPGRKLQGYVCFEVPESAEAVELEYETSFWTQDKVIFAVE